MMAVLERGRDFSGCQDSCRRLLRTFEFCRGEQLLLTHISDEVELRIPTDSDSEVAKFQKIRKRISEHLATSTLELQTTLREMATRPA
jgi:hypothetical protein